MIYFTAFASETRAAEREHLDVEEHNGRVDRCAHNKQSEYLLERRVLQDIAAIVRSERLDERQAKWRDLIHALVNELGHA